MYFGIYYFVVIIIYNDGDISSKQKENFFFIFLEKVYDASITELEIFMTYNVIINYFRKLKIIICITFFLQKLKYVFISSFY